MSAARTHTTADGEILVGGEQLFSSKKTLQDAHGAFRRITSCIFNFWYLKILFIIITTTTADPPTPVSNSLISRPGCLIASLLDEDLYEFQEDLCQQTRRCFVLRFLTDLLNGKLQCFGRDAQRRRLCATNKVHNRTILRAKRESTGTY